jgi:hypothetical protein
MNWRPMRTITLALLPLLILLANNSNLPAAEDNVYIFAPSVGKFVPRSAMFAKEPGNYELAIRALNPEIEPGGTINLEVFITGYGEIKGAKVYFLAPPQFIQTGKAIFGLTEKRSLDNLREFEFGGREALTNEHGIIWIGIAGFGANEQEATSFIDVHYSKSYVGQKPFSHILTENKSKNAPISLDLKTKEDVKPGRHQLKLYFTYFNGKEWKTSLASTEVEILTWMKRNEFKAYCVGIIFTIIALFPGYFNVWHIYATRKEKKEEKFKEKENETSKKVK